MFAKKFSQDAQAVPAEHLSYCIAKKKKGALHDESRLS
jgi:hypothetical protein